MNGADRHFGITSSSVHLFTSSCFRWVGLIGILTIAVMRCMIVFAPAVVFDGDPAVDATPFMGVGMPGSMFLDVILLLACAFALFGESWGGRGLNRTVMTLVLIPMPVILWHGSYDAGNLWLGSTWLAAVAAGATIAHLARDRVARIVIIAVLSGAVVPILARGVVQIAHEHPATVRMYEATKQQFLRDRGWQPDSSSARIYERRLRQPQPTGWFPTSNIFASVAAFGLVLWVGLAVTATRLRLESGWAGAMILCALAAGGLLWFTGSKGAVLAIAAGIMLLMITVGPQALARRVASRAGLIVIAFIFLAILGVVLRGTRLPENFAGDKSLLFRWHYLTAAARIYLDQPLLGVGPDGFQAAYMLHRVPRNPEEVASAHSVFVDWLCTLGISGAAWIALMLIMIGWNRVDSSPPSQQLMPSESDSKRTRNVLIRSLACVVVVAFGTSTLIDWPGLDGVSLLGRAIAIIGFVLAAGIAAHILNLGPAQDARLIVLAAVATLVIHAQIEMTFVQPGPVVWAMCAVGAIGIRDSRRNREKDSKTTFRAAGVFMALPAILILLFTAVWITMSGVVPAFQQQHLMNKAAELLAPVRQNNQDLELMLRQRQAAANTLVDAYEIWPSNLHPLQAAADQLERACSAPNGPQPLGLLMQARDVLQRALRAHNDSGSLIMAIGVDLRLALLTQDSEYWNEAIEMARELTQRDPHSLSAWKRFGDVLWAAGKRTQAADAYRRALECDASFSLDELKQLPESDREKLRRRVAESEE